MHYGANGDHFIMVFEILGVNLLEIMKRYDYKGIPLPLVRRVARQVLIGLDYLHRICKIIHTDLKPENTIVALSNDKLKDIIDHGIIRKTNQKNKKAQTLMVDYDNRQYIPDTKSRMSTQASSILDGINTEGMSKTQRKKLKKKLKKEQHKDHEQAKEEDEEEPEETQEAQVKPAEEQLKALRDEEEDVEFRRPRSYSLPNL